MRVCHKPHPIRPVRAKALYIAQYFKAFALSGRLADCNYTQVACGAYLRSSVLSTLRKVPNHIFVFVTYSQSMEGL